MNIKEIALLICLVFIVLQAISYFMVTSHEKKEEALRQKNGNFNQLVDSESVDELDKAMSDGD